MMLQPSQKIARQASSSRLHASARCVSEAVLVVRVCVPQVVCEELKVQSQSEAVRVVRVCVLQVVCEELKVQSQNDTAKLAEAKNKVYLKVCCCCCCIGRRLDGAWHWACIDQHAADTQSVTESVCHACRCVSWCLACLVP